MTAEQVLAIARAELGAKENPKGSNKVKYNTWYYGQEVSGDSYPWCMVFVQWVFHQAGVALPVKTASCGALMRAAQAAGCWVTSDYKPGDVVIYDLPGGAATDHTGIIESVSDTSVTAIEGNTSVNNASNGGEVRRMTRKLSLVVGAVRPEYDKEDDNMDKEKFKELWLEYRKELQDNDSSAYSTEAREWAIANGIIQGGDPLPDGSPNYLWEDIMTREQLITVMYRFAKLVGLA